MSDDISFQLRIYVDDKTIYSSLNSKPDQCDKIKLAAGLKNDLQCVFN